MENYTFAFQPIVDVSRRCCTGFEALVRGPADEAARIVLASYRITQTSLFEFDAAARERAIALASDIGLPKDAYLSLNLLPASLEEMGDAPFESTMAAIERSRISPRQIVIEVSESERIADFRRFYAMANQYRARGLRFALDDFGAGYAGLNLLAEFQPDLIKLDMSLVTRIWERGPRQAIIRGVIRTCEDLGIDVVAEGVESIEEYQWLRDENISMFQGYLFARPQFKAFSDANFPS